MGRDGTPTRPGEGAPAGLDDEDLIEARAYEELGVVHRVEVAFDERRRRLRLLEQTWLVLVSAVRSGAGWLLSRPGVIRPEPPPMSPIEPEQRGGDRRSVQVDAADGTASAAEISAPAPEDPQSGTEGHVEGHEHRHPDGPEGHYEGRTL